MISAFDEADYYSCDELSEEFIDESVEETVAGRIDAESASGETMRETIARIAPVTVYAFKRKPVEPAWIENTVGRLTDVLTEDWMDEFGDPEGDHAPQIDEAATKLAEAVAVLVQKSDVWQCELVGEREFALDALLDMAEDP